MNKRKAMIVGIKSLYLSKKEIYFLKKYKPWGIILFTRNIKNLKQVINLVSSIKKIFLDVNYPILIDQEGGKVSRLNNIIDTSNFTADYFGKLFLTNKKKFNTYYKIYIDQISYLLRQIGVNINTVPVLDVRRKKTSSIIGNRSYGYKPQFIDKIGDFCISNFHNNKIATVIKHIPGHGLAKLDSHNFTPIVNEKKNKIFKEDFLTFKNKKSLFAITAHVIYLNIDPYNTATHSSKIINLIRNKIKFKNLIISDDLSMKALKYSLRINTIKAFNAGCNLVLHCNGNYSEMVKVAENSPIVDKFIIKKTSQFYNFLS